MGNAEDKEKKPKRIETKEINSHSQTQMLSLIRDEFTNVYYLTVKVCKHV